MAKCVDEKELESQYEALRQFVRVAEDGGALMGTWKKVGLTMPTGGVGA